jgi:TPP-dependent pyruvate/acetoin dehydrogenase alpha subunit
MRLTSEHLVQACERACTVRRFEERAHDESATDQFLGFVGARAGRHADTCGPSIEEGGGS